MINTTTIKRKNIINNVVMSGYYTGIEKDELLLKNEELENHQIVKIYVSKELQDKIIKHIKENDLIGIKVILKLITFIELL